MTTVTLEEPCTICRSTRWCGRQCKHAPSNKASVAHMPAVTHASPNEPSPNPKPQASPNSRYARNARWRAKNRDRYNISMRDLMRRKRSAEKATTVA